MELLPGGANYSADVSTRRSHPFAADLRHATFDADQKLAEDDEVVGGLIGFKIRSEADLRTIMELSAGSTPTVMALG